MSNRQSNHGDADEMTAKPLKPKPLHRQVLDAILVSIEEYRRAVATLRARKFQQRSLARRLWGIEYDDEAISIDAPDEPDWARMAEAAEQEKRELTAVVERVAALLTYFAHLVDGKGTTGITPIVCGRNRRKLPRWKTHAGWPL
jgi:hypothetical protein